MYADGRVAIAVLVAITAVIGNLWRRRHRSLYLVDFAIFTPPKKYMVSHKKFLVHAHFMFGNHLAGYVA